jgi:hypothetical protein
LFGAVTGCGGGIAESHAPLRPVVPVEAESGKENKEDEDMTAEPRSTVTKPAPRPVPASGTRADPDRNPARVLSVIAVASIAAGAINIAAAATVGRASAQNLAFFVVVAAAQLGWGAVALARAPRWWLALGAAGNLVVAATWVVSRTVGLPVGVYAGITLPVGFPDALAMALEVVVVAGAATLLIRGRTPARTAARSLGVTVAAAVVAGALALGGVLAQAGAIGSTSAGNGAGVNGPATPGGGGGTSGGGVPGYTSGGGTSGGGTSGGGTSGGGTSGIPGY